VSILPGPGSLFGAPALYYSRSGPYNSPLLHIWYM
jgi:hypothetical protein